jgi:hypothetical protein
VLIEQNSELTPFVYNTKIHMIEDLPYYLYNNPNVISSTCKEILMNIDNIEYGFNMFIYDREQEITYLAQSIDFDYFD